jgi:hypothetical protein
MCVPRQLTRIRARREPRHPRPRLMALTLEPEVRAPAGFPVPRAAVSFRPAGWSRQRVFLRWHRATLRLRADRIGRLCASPWMATASYRGLLGCLRAVGLLFFMNVLLLVAAVEATVTMASSKFRSLHLPPYVGRQGIGRTDAFCCPCGSREACSSRRDGAPAPRGARARRRSPS